METLSVIHGHNGPLGHYTTTMGGGVIMPHINLQFYEKVNYDSPCAAPVLIKFPLVWVKDIDL